jgi:hypothetical protein
MIKVTIRALIQNLIFFSYRFEGKIQMVFCRLFNRQISPLFSWLIALAIFVLSPSVGLTFQGENQGKSKAPEAKASEKPTVDEDVEESLKEVLQGHSTHGEAFNEGPRQSAYLMGGTGNIHFPVTTDSKQAQAFIEQGIGQLHGFGTSRRSDLLGKLPPWMKTARWLIGALRWQPIRSEVDHRVLSRKPCRGLNRCPSERSSILNL